MYHGLGTHISSPASNKAIAPPDTGDGALKRPNQSADEIDQLSALSVSELLEALRRRGPVLALETLAYLVRRAQNDGVGGTEVLEAALRQLSPRSRRIARASAKDWVADDDWKDIGQEALISMARGLADTADGALSPWEVNFWNTFKCDCIDALRVLRRKAAREMKSFQEFPGGDDSPALGSRPPHTLDRLTKREILAVLSPGEARAFALVYFEGIQVSGGEGTVMGLMGKSREMIYKHLRAAKAKISADPRFDSWVDGG